MESQDDPSKPSSEEQHEDQISDYLDRAIQGVFVFAFQKLPGWIGNSLALVFRYTFGWLWQLIQGTARFFKKALIWLFWTLPKKVLEWLVNSASYLLRLGWNILKALVLAAITFGPLLISLNMNQFVEVSLAWCAIAIIGAGWGVVYLNRSRWKIGQIIGRLATRLKFWKRTSLPSLPESVEK